MLEIACGPGRLTAAMRGVRMGVAVDSSAEMLTTAQQRMNGAAGAWSFLRTDAFVLPFQSESFDAVYTLRFVRHFQLPERQRLYREVRRVLRPRGVFMVDALNRDVSYPYRVKRGLERYHIYDVLYRPRGNPGGIAGGWASGSSLWSRRSSTSPCSASSIVCGA